MKSDPIGVVVIGTGGMGQLHVQNCVESPDAELVGVYDVAPEAARRVAAQFGVKKVYESLIDAVGEPRADAVIVATPNVFHRESVVAALEVGKHCLCEKPLAVRAADIAAMIAARDRSGRLLMTAQHLRFEERSRTLKRMIDAGRLGDVYYTRAWWLRRRFAPTTPGFLTRAQAGRGPGMDLGVHVLDLALHLLDQPTPVSVSGVATCQLGRRPDVTNQWGTYAPAAFEVEDFAAGLIRFADGAALSLEVSWLSTCRAELCSVGCTGRRRGCAGRTCVAHVQEGAWSTRKWSAAWDGRPPQPPARVSRAIRSGGPSPRTRGQS
jgi:predicted dehydrogenase